MVKHHGTHGCGSLGQLSFAMAPDCSVEPVHSESSHSIWAPSSPSSADSFTGAPFTYNQSELGWPQSSPDLSSTTLLHPSNAIWSWPGLGEQGSGWEAVQRTNQRSECGICCGCTRDILNSFGLYSCSCAWFVLVPFSL